MIRYAQSTRCRMQLLLEYFGETPPLCRRCDNCLDHGEDAAVEHAPELQPPRELPDEEDVVPSMASLRAELSDTPKLPRPPRKETIFF